MLRIIDRYLLRELLASVLASAVILLLIMVGGTIADVLARIARGKFPADLLFALIGLRTIDALPILLPLAVFLGVLLAYGRLWRDSEMAVLAAAGVGTRDLLRPLLLLVLPAMVGLAAISFWLAPASVRQAQAMTDEANRSLIVAGLEPERFVDLPGRDGVIYVGEMDSDGVHFRRLFIESERVDATSGKTQIDVITATHGYLYHDADGNGRYLALQDGFRVEGRLGEDDYRLMRFARNDLKLPDNDSDYDAISTRRSAPTRVLWASDELLERAELQWRLAAPLSALVLALLALPLSRSSPREPRYARLLIAVLVYLVYANFVGLGRTWITQGKLAPWLGFWWIYVPTLLLALLMMWRGEHLRRARTRPVTA